MEEIDDITLERASRGNAVAFRILYAHYSPFVWRLCYRSCNGELGVAEEIMQDTFIKVYRYLSSFAKGSAFSTWLYKITYNCINEHFAKQTKMNSRTVALSEDAVDPKTGAGVQGQSFSQDPDVVPYENEQITEKILALLGEEDRFLITAREVDGLSFKELSDVTGITEGALRVRITRLKTQIRDAVEKMDF